MRRFSEGNRDTLNTPEEKASSTREEGVTSNAPGRLWYTRSSIAVAVGFVAVMSDSVGVLVNVEPSPAPSAARSKCNKWSSGTNIMSQTTLSVLLPIITYTKHLMSR
jgi:hypothetical protein